MKMYQIMHLQQPEEKPTEESADPTQQPSGVEEIALEVEVESTQQMK
jgi:hypothetical protein